MHQYVSMTFKYRFDPGGEEIGPADVRGWQMECVKMPKLLYPS